MYSTRPIRWNIKSAPTSPGRSSAGPALYTFSLLGRDAPPPAPTTTLPKDPLQVDRRPCPPSAWAGWEEFETWVKVVRCVHSRPASTVYSVLRQNLLCWLDCYVHNGPPSVFSLTLTYTVLYICEHFINFFCELLVNIASGTETHCTPVLLVRDSTYVLLCSPVMYLPSFYPIVLLSFFRSF
jgi:hypothetical protein